MPPLFDFGWFEWIVLVSLVLGLVGVVWMYTHHYELPAYSTACGLIAAAALTVGLHAVQQNRRTLRQLRDTQDAVRVISRPPTTQQLRDALDTAIAMATREQLAELLRRQIAAAGTTPAKRRELRRKLRQVTPRPAPGSSQPRPPTRERPRRPPVRPPPASRQPRPDPAPADPNPSPAPEAPPETTPSPVPPERPPVPPTPVPVPPGPPDIQVPPIGPITVPPVCTPIVRINCPPGT